MNKFLLLCLFLLCKPSFGVVPDNVRKEYALKFHQAFILQSIGKSTTAFNQFLEAFRQGTDSGESPKKLQVISNIFYWYRQHGSCLKLFGRQPTYADRIHAEYCNCGEEHEYYSDRTFQRPPISVAPHQLSSILARVPEYHSEFGTNPQQAALVRDFMFGVGELIAGVLTIYVGKSGAIASIGGSIAYSGLKTMWSSGNSLWSNHQMAILKLKQLTEEAEMLSRNNQ